MSELPESEPEANEAVAAPRQRQPGELLFALLLLMGAAVLLHQAYQIAGFRSFSSAGVFPMLAAGVMVLSGIAIVIKTARTRAEHAGLPFAPFLSEVTGPKILFVGGMIAAYLFALEPLGFVVSSILFLSITICVLHRKNYIWMVLLSVVSVAIIYGLFRYVFVVMLPQGAFI
jgi:putative tricarboxylic transport membrane protein